MGSTTSNRCPYKKKEIQAQDTHQGKLSMRQQIRHWSNVCISQGKSRTVGNTRIWDRGKEQILLLGLLDGTNLSGTSILTSGL